MSAPEKTTQTTTTAPPLCNRCDTPLEYRKALFTMLDAKNLPTGETSIKWLAYNHPSCENERLRGYPHRCWKCYGCRRMLIWVGPPDAKKDKDGKLGFAATLHSDQTKMHFCREWLERRRQEREIGTD